MLGASPSWSSSSQSFINSTKTGRPLTRQLAPLRAAGSNIVGGGPVGDAHQLLRQAEVKANPQTESLFDIC